MNRSPYEILGINPKATQEEIKNAYRSLAKKFHPDFNLGNKEAERRFKEISGAYELIGTVEERAKQDRADFHESTSSQPRGEDQRGSGPFYYETQQGGGRYSNRF